MSSVCSHALHLIVVMSNVRFYMQNQHKSIPGQDTSTMQKVLNVATSSLQSYKPVNNICQHVCAFHFYANDMSRQVCSL